MSGRCSTDDIKLVPCFAEELATSRNHSKRSRRGDVVATVAGRVQDLVCGLLADYTPGTIMQYDHFPLQI